MATIYRFPKSSKNKIDCCRSKVEVEMAKLFTSLERQGFRREEIAIHLSDAADDYILMLAKELHPEE